MEIINESEVKDYQVPYKKYVINTIVTSYKGKFELWIGLKNRRYMIDIGSEHDMFRKKERVERFLRDSRNWPGLKSVEDIIGVARRI